MSDTAPPTDPRLQAAVADLQTARWSEGEAKLRAVLKDAPDNANALHFLGFARFQQQDPAEGLQLIRAAINRRPDLFGAHNNLGTICFLMHDMAGAEAAFRAAAALRPQDANVQSNLGNVLVATGHYTGAVACYQAALAAQPGHAGAFSGLANAYHLLGRVDDAAAAAGAAVMAEPEKQGVLAHYIHLRRRLCDWDGLAAHVDRLRVQAAAPTYAGPVFPLLGLFDDPALHRAAAEASTRNLGLRARDPKAVRQARADKIRVAYLSNDFRAHAVASLIAGVFEHHDRSRFETYGISYGPVDNSDIRRRIERELDHFLEARAMTDAEIAAYLVDQAIDIAVDLTGLTQAGRAGILKDRPAPVQVNYLGYPGTMGVDFIDYVVADATVLPLDQQPFYSERILHLPHCYQPNDTTRACPSTPPGLDHLGLPDDGFVFCCFNNSFKISSEVFDVWMDLLQAVPGSVLWLLSDNPTQEGNLRGAAQARGVDPARLVFAPRVDVFEHLARHRAADLFLDTFPYTAHTTASDALWMGLPIVTRQGVGFASRVAASILRTAGLPDMVTETIEDYRALALRLATDPRKLAEVRARLAQGRTGPLFDTAGLTRSLEALYLSIVRR